MTEDIYAKKRHKMVAKGIAGYGIRQEDVLEAMRRVPRHLFVDPDFQGEAYKNQPLPIGHGQTISQPYIVGFMTELARVGKDSKVLEVGTGSGYQAAVLAEIVNHVYSIEYIEPLGLEAKDRLEKLGYKNVSVKIGDGYQGWPEHQPFDAILVTAAIDHVPQPLIDQLAPKGRLVIPVGDTGFDQEILLIEKNEKGALGQTRTIPVRFVPFLGEKERE